MKHTVVLLVQLHIKWENTEMQEHTNHHSEEIKYRWTLLRWNNFNRLHCA